MNQEQMRARTKEFARSVICLCRELPKNQECRLIGAQMFRSGASVGANYRAACRGRSKADFVSKLGMVLEEADETLYWMEILSETQAVKAERLLPLMQEAGELIAIFVASLNTARAQ